MSISTFLAGQCRKPSGFFGRLLVGRLLSRGNAPMNELTKQLLDLVPDDRVLEVGFGGGDLIARMAPALGRGRIVGVDLSSDMTALCAKRSPSSCARDGSSYAAGPSSRSRTRTARSPRRAA